MNRIGASKLTVCIYRKKESGVLVLALAVLGVLHTVELWLVYFTAYSTSPDI